MIEDTEFEPSTGIPITIKTYPGSFTARSLPCKVIVEKNKPKQYGPTECWERFIASQSTWI
jgi:hypothetical protein